MAAPCLNALHEAVPADERVQHLRSQAQESIVPGNGDIPADQVPCVDLLEDLVNSAAFSLHEQLPGDGLPKQQAGDTNPISSAVLAAAQQRWQALLLERLHAAQMLLPDMPLAATPRTTERLGKINGQAQEAWERIGSSSFVQNMGLQGPVASKLLYNAEDLLEAVTAVVNARQGRQSTAEARKGLNTSAAAQPATRTSLLQSVRAPSRLWLQSFFADLRADKRQVGVDDVLHCWFREQQVQQAHKAAAGCSAATCRAAARGGLPASQRPWVWATALGLHATTPPEHSRGAAEGQSAASPVVAATDSREAWWQLPSQRDKQILQLLCESVEQQVLLTDALTCTCVQHMVDNEHYFVFAEAMRALVLAFSRDAAVSRHAAVLATPRLAAEVPGATLLRLYPPSGVLPFQGMACYLAPLMFLYEHPAAVYKVFLAMYCRHWCCLHTLNGKPAPSPGLPVLCRTLLDLLQEIDPEVFQHLSQLSSSPLDLVLP